MQSSFILRRVLVVAVVLPSVLLALQSAFPWNDDATSDCWHHDGHGTRTWYDGDKPGC